jgi:hypothetical protein
MIVGGAAIMLLIVWGAMKYSDSKSTTSEQAVRPDGAPVNLIATLDPQNYSGRARAAYQAAKEIPEVLAQLPCFCGCMDSLGHKSNLYCFADNHGNICDLCQSIALDAQEMHHKGMTISQIRENIRNTYAHVQ